MANDIILESKDNTNIYKLAKGIELLTSARVRKIGYEKWDRSAIWFSTYEQKHSIEIIEQVIKRLEDYCRAKAQTIMINI